MTRALGIDVGTSHIRIAEIESSGRKRRLLGMYELARDSQYSNAGQQLRAFFETSGLMADRIGLGTGAEPIMIRTFEFPFSNMRKVEGAIQAEFEDSLPFDISQHVLEIRPMGKSGKIHKFLGGLMPKSSLAELDKLTDESGILINSYYADVEAMAQLALNQNLPASNTDAPYAVCDLGHASTKIAFLKGGRPRFLNRKASEDHPSRILDVRTINRGGNELVNWIREKNVLSQEDALQWLVHRAEIRVLEEGAPPALAGDISDEIKMALRPVVVELYQTIQSFKTKHGGMPLAVYVTGGLSGLKGIREFLSQELHVPFHSWPIFEGFETHNMPLTIERERTFAAAIAIAHRWSYTASEGWLNFKRMTSQKKFLTSFFASFARPELKHVAWGLGLSAAAAIIYNVSGSFLLSQQSTRVETDLVSELRKIDRDLGKNAPKIAKDPVRAQEIFDKAKKKKLAENTKTSDAPVSRARSEVLLDISEALPSGSMLKRIGIVSAGAGLAVESTYKVASAPSPEDIKRAQEGFTQNLSRRGYHEVTLQASTTDKTLLTLRTKWKGGQQ